MQKKRILVLGSAGMAGHVITRFLKNSKDRFDVIDVARSNEIITPSFILDVTNFGDLENLINNESPDIIINCIGLLNLTAEENPDKAILLNSYLPHFLEAITRNTDSKVVHISTDCVFSGNKGGYVENDFKDGRGFYAQSKALGEIINHKDLTIRTSIIGPELNDNGIGLFHWFSKRTGEIKGYTGAYWSGVTTIELAKAIVSMLEQNTTGLCHLTNGIKISKYNLLNHFKEIFPASGVGNIKPDDTYKVDKSLSNSRTDFNYSVPGYEKMIIEMREWIRSNHELYPHYRSLIA